MAPGLSARPALSRFETDASLLSSATEDTELEPSSSPRVAVQPFSRVEDPVVSWFFTPPALITAGLVAACVALLAHHTPKLALPERVQAHLGLWSACAVLLVFCMCVVDDRDEAELQGG
jgi:hypothetical protein